MGHDTCQLQIALLQAQVNKLQQTLDTLLKKGNKKTGHQQTAKEEELSEEEDSQEDEYLDDLVEEDFGQWHQESTDNFFLLGNFVEMGLYLRKNRTGLEENKRHTCQSSRKETGWSRY